MTFSKDLARILYVPLMLVGFLSAAVVAVESCNTYLPLLVLLGGAITISFATERFVPYDPSWNEGHDDTKRDWLHFIVNETSNVLNIVALPAVVMLLPTVDFWPHTLPLWGQMLLAIFFADIGITLMHYWSHILPTLWRLHAPHHSVKRMYGFNGLMKHPLHQSLETLGGVFPLILVGMPQDVAALLGFAVALQLLLQHTNVDVKIGLLRYVLALSPVHRFTILSGAAKAM